MSIHTFKWYTFLSVCRMHQRNHLLHNLTCSRCSNALRNFDKYVCSYIFYSKIPGPTSIIFLTKSTFITLMATYIDVYTGTIWYMHQAKERKRYNVISLDGRIQNDPCMYISTLHHTGQLGVYSLTEMMAKCPHISISSMTIIYQEWRTGN